MKGRHWKRSSPGASKVRLCGHPCAWCRAQSKCASFCLCTVHLEEDLLL